MQTNRSELLCMVEFAINNSEHLATKYTHVFMNYGRHPLTPFGRTILPLRELGIDMPDVEFLSLQMEEVWANALQNLTEARDRFKSYADLKRVEKKYKLEDMVMLRSNIMPPVFGVR
jgi:hypothetical protein